MRLGDLLTSNAIISKLQLDEALKAQKTHGKQLGVTLLEQGAIEETKLLSFLAQQLDIAYINLDKVTIDQNAVKMIPEASARRFRSIVLSECGSTVFVAMSDPTNLANIDHIKTIITPKKVEIILAKEQQVISAINNFYRRTQEIESFATQLQAEHKNTNTYDINSITEEADDSTVVKLLQSIFEDAVQMNASDIHIEPDEKQLRIRQRIDGILYENVLQQVGISAALVLRLKLMSSLDITEKRLPQDGRFSLNIGGNQLDVRVSTMPIQFGESVVMRILNQSSKIFSLDEIGMPSSILNKMRNALSRPHGMILVTGPTGSGKSTTLYASLNELNLPEKKIITVEDPVEFRLPRVNQIQVNNKIDLSFASVLRTALRQDPDILMVGEMRDQETVAMGLRGALTGHLVLSTLHTNDAISSAIRLIDMKAPSYLVASSLRAILAQRLVRRVCPICAEEHTPDIQETAWIKHISNQFSDAKYKSGKGCNSCMHTGYQGRIGVFEWLEMNESMVDTLRAEDVSAFAIEAKKSPDYKPLAVMALELATQGVTSLDEVFKLAEVMPDAVMADAVMMDEVMTDKVMTDKEEQ
jgi:MSHA biogenesis protein MshE